jgi:putative transposase
MLSDNGSPYIARDTRIFASQLGLRPCYTPVKSPESNGMAEAFVKTLKRDYVHVTPLPTPNRPRIDRRVDRGLQRQPPALRAEDALAPRVHRSSNRNRLSVR